MSVTQAWDMQYSRFASPRDLLAFCSTSRVDRPGDAQFFQLLSGTRFGLAWVIGGNLTLVTSPCPATLLSLIYTSFSLRLLKNLQVVAIAANGRISPKHNGGSVYTSDA